jgi:hypothetical protein
VGITIGGIIEYIDGVAVGDAVGNNVVEALEGSTEGALVLISNNGG